MANQLGSLCRELCLLTPARLVRGERRRRPEKWTRLELLKALYGAPP